MPQGGMLRIMTADRTLTTELSEPDLPPGDYVEIEVTDSGVGISHDLLSRVFEPFFTTKPTGQGTGLGLSQVYGFVKQSGGHVRIESVPGEGTRARIYLPGRAPLPTPVAENQPTRKNFDSPCAAQRGKILVVEDQEEVRSQIVDTLVEIGCKAIEVGDGTAGLKIIESDEPLDLLISDVGLPGLSGLQLAEAARAAHPNLPILLITGYAGRSAETLQLAPNMEVLRKPFTLDELAAKVQATFQRTSRAE